jgi:hypothetical protein
VAVAGVPPTVFGDGRQTRCFAHVLDVVDALILPAGPNYNTAHPIMAGSRGSSNAFAPHRGCAANQGPLRRSLKERIPN